MKQRAADGKRVAAESEFLKKYAPPYKTRSYMIEVHHVGYQMKDLQISSRSMYNLMSFVQKKFFDPTFLLEEEKDEEEEEEEEEE